jgi:uncharacterized membrane protein
VGLITGLLTLPLAPVRGTMWVAEKLLEEAERELDDPRTIAAQLDDLEQRFQRGEISAEEYELLEDALMRRLTPGGW